MRALTFSLGAGLFLMVAASSVSAEGLYVGGQIGVGAGGGETDNSGFDLELAPGPVIDVFVGTTIGSFRLEGEFAYRQNDMDNIAGFPVIGEMTSTALMANGYYDFGDGTGFTPYLGLGLGVANVTFDSAVSDDDTTIAIQLMAGGAFPLSDNTAMTVDLRAFGVAPVFTDGFGASISQEYNIISLMMGFRTSF